MDLRRVLRQHLVTAVYRKGDKVTLHFHTDSPIKGERLVAFIEKNTYLAGTLDVKKGSS